VIGQVKLLSESVLNFGLAECSSSELELMASDFIMKNSTLLVRQYPKNRSPCCTPDASHLANLFTLTKISIFVEFSTIGNDSACSNLNSVTLVN